MPFLNEQIKKLSDVAALSTLELVLRKVGLVPDPFTTGYLDDQLREALRQPDLPPLGISAVELHTDGDIARSTLLYLAERDEAFRKSIQHVLARGTEQESGAAMRDPGTFALGAMVLLAFRTDLELRKQPGKGWYFHFKLKPLRDSPVGKVLAMLYTKLLGPGNIPE